MHKKVMVRVNAPVDEGIAPLVQALSEIEGLVTLESCQGEPGTQSAFVVFYVGSWKDCGALLFDMLLPVMGPDIRSAVSLRVEAYDTEIVRAWITLDPGAIKAMSDCVRSLAASSVG